MSGGEKVRLASMKSFPGSPPDHQIQRMVEIQEAIAYALENVRPNDRLMSACHEALVLAGLKAASK
jgi:hypothetical protein